MSKQPTVNKLDKAFYSTICFVIFTKILTMNKVLILFAHPRYEKSRTNKALLEGLRGQDGITIHDLYELYPDFNIDTAREQELLQAH